jgi:putative spermidine/putrescine transport system substrate-binding protein
MTGITRRRLLGATALAVPAIWGVDATAQIRRGDELTVGVWGGAQERIVREFCAAPLERQHGVRINFVLGGTPERRARAYAERGRPSFDVVYLNIFESRQAVRDGVTQAPNANVPNFEHLYPWRGSAAMAWPSTRSPSSMTGARSRAP